MQGCSHLVCAKGLLADGELWMKGRLYDRLTGQRCLLGALKKSIELEGIVYNEPDPIMVVTRIIEEYGFYTIAQFNDSPSTRWADVKEVLDKAIERCSDRPHDD